MLTDHGVFPSAPSPTPKAAFHPLANPFVKRVVPFCIFYDDEVTSEKEAAGLFDAVAMDDETAFLQLTEHDFEEDFGEEVREVIAGRTGLYVLVDDMDAILQEPFGEALAFSENPNGAQHFLVETAAGLIVFAETKAHALRLAA